MPRNTTPNIPTPSVAEYYEKYQRTPSEFHVTASTTGGDPHTGGEGRFNVLNALNLLACWHTTYGAALACAAGRCTRGRSRKPAS
jgi:hypothetical protein